MTSNLCIHMLVAVAVIFAQEWLVHLHLWKTTDPVPMQVLEKLYRLKWGPLDGLGSLIISPTRELALQIFDELCKIGKKHDFSAGLLIGGKKVKEEQERVHGKHRIPVSAYWCSHACKHASMQACTNDHKGNQQDCTP